MSKFASKYNKVTFDYQIPEGVPYVRLAEIREKFGTDAVIPIRALYINKKSKYGNAPVVATDKGLVNLPHHLCDVAVEMLADEEFIKAVNEGKIGFKTYEYQTSYGTALSVEWVDL